MMKIPQLFKMYDYQKALLKFKGKRIMLVMRRRTNFRSYYLLQRELDKRGGVANEHNS